MLLAIAFLAFISVSQGGLTGKRTGYYESCPVLSMTKLHPYRCRLVHKCSSEAAWTKRSSSVISVTEYFCPKPNCRKKVIGKCGWEVCACEDHRGISQVGKGAFFYGDKDVPGTYYSCSCDSDPEILSICGAKCKKLEGPKPVTAKAPRPPPRFPPLPEWI